MSNNIIQIKKIDDTLYLLNEAITQSACITMLLVIGEEKVAVIDTGYGSTGDLDKVIANITDKPVICLLTHCDPDHASGAALFDNVYMNQLDSSLMKSGLNYQIRLMGIKKMADTNEIKIYAKEHMVKTNTFAYQNVQDGDVFDLGGRKLEAISLGGHTKGSMCYYDRIGNYVMTGDSVANVNSAVLFFDKGLPLSVYRSNLNRFVGIINTDTVIYTGHDTEPLDKRVIPELLVLCDEIIAGETDGDSPYMPPFLQAARELDKPVKGLFQRILLGAVSKILLKNTKPMEHKKYGFITSIKYNAKKI
jgi:glyoxylase-like metal-dependent hydrolase (beta-lactamase superfamily II)